MLPQKIKILKLVKSEFHATKFPDFVNFVAFSPDVLGKFHDFQVFEVSGNPASD